jgi:hypothetical protein
MRNDIGGSGISLALIVHHGNKVFIGGLGVPDGKKTSAWGSIQWLPLLSFTIVYCHV